MVGGAGRGPDGGGCGGVGFGGAGAAGVRLVAAGRFDDTAASPDVSGPAADTGRGTPVPPGAPAPVGLPVRAPVPPRVEAVGVTYSVDPAAAVLPRLKRERAQAVPRLPVRHPRPAHRVVQI